MQITHILVLGLRSTTYLNIPRNNMKKIFIIFVASFIFSTTQAISFYSGEWESTDKSCNDTKGHLSLSIKKNGMFSVAMFCELEKGKNICEKSKRKNTRLSMAYGKINKNNELVVTKHEGFKPAGNLSKMKATGTFISKDNCKGKWSAKH